MRPFRIHSSMRRAMLGAALVSCICLCCRPSDAAPSKKIAKTAEPYTESISGSLVTFDMVSVPAGVIQVPDPAKKGVMKRIKVGPFWIGKTEVTWDQYDVFVFRLDEPTGIINGSEAISHPSKPYGAADRGYGHKGYPVINESYFGAESYCKWLSAKTGRKYRLPTEAEWEYACRAGKSEPKDKNQLEQCAWFWQEKTQPVGKKSPNSWGLCDALGNVAEWCAGLDGKPVVCGGSWQDTAKKCNPLARQYQDESWQANDPQNPKSKWWLSDATFVGFRVLREP